MNPDNVKRKWALVIEDEPVISRACKRTLETEGFEVDLAMNGLVAKEMVAVKNYDLCLSDIKTPGMNGMDFYKHIEKEHPSLTSKIIFTTGDSLSVNIDTFLKEVKRPILNKPFLPDDLRKILNSL